MGRTDQQQVTRRGTGDDVFVGGEIARLAATVLTLVDAIDTGLVVVYEHDDHPIVNARAAEWLGVDPARVRTVDIATALARLQARSIDGTTPAEHAAAQLADPEGVIDHWILHFDHVPTHLRVSSHPLPDDTTPGRIWVFMDVSAEMTAAEQARASEARYQMLVEHSADVVASANAAAEITWISPSVEAMLGWTPTELEGRPLAGLIHDADRPRLAAASAEVLAGGDVRMEGRVLCKDGSYRWVESLVRPVLDEQGTVVGRVARWRDIDQLHAAHAELEASEARYRMLVEHTRDVVTTVNVAVEITWISASVESMLGWKPAELKGRPLVSLVHTDDLPVVATTAAKTLAGHDANVEVRMRRKDGGYRWIESFIRPVLDEQGTVVGRVARWRDIDELHAARAELEASEARFRALVEHATDIVYTSDADSRITWITPTVERSLGWSPDALMGTSILDLVHPEDLPEIQARRSAVTADVDIFDADERFVCRVRHHDGAYSWMSLRLTVLADETGAFAGVVGGFRDIDELQQARIDAEVAAATMRATADALHDPQALLSPVRSAGRIVDFCFDDLNDAALSFLAERGPVLGRRLLEVFPPMAGSELFARFVECVESGVPMVIDEVAFDSIVLGRTVWYDFRGTAVGDRLVLVWRDVTDRHNAARALAESEQHFREEAHRNEMLRAELDTILTEGSVLAVRVSSQGVIDWVSGSATHMLGVDPAALVGRPFTRWIHPDDTPRLTLLATMLRGTDPPAVVNARIRRHDGSYVAFAGTFFAIEEDGNLVYRATLYDVSERLEAERLRALVVSVASHELKTPLAFLYATLSMFVDGTIAQGTPVADDLLARALASTERLTRMTTSLLQLQRLDLGATLNVDGPVDIASTTAEAADTVPNDRGIEVTATHGDGIPPLWVDADLVAQAVINLVANAVKFSPDGGTVEVDTQAFGDGVRITVRDRGIGVPPERREAIFEAFAQATPEDRRTGSGLGLAIVARIADLHLGRVWVEDPPEGPGSVFVLELHSVPREAGPPADR